MAERKIFGVIQMEGFVIIYFDRFGLEALFFRERIVVNNE